jgi:class 3 POU domain transcription factor
MEYSVESPEQEDSTVPSDVRFTSCQPRQFKTSRKRTLIEGSLKDALEKHFDQDPKPSLKAIVSLARSLRLKSKVVRVWFANRRHKQKYLNPIAKSNRPGNRTASQQAPVPCPIADETADTAMRDHDGSVNENNSSTVEQITGKLIFIKAILKDSPESSF